ncbi:MAG: HNH endonuclease [Ktedonobacter sp. 13_1_20CM_3_54_15]|nr:MAG: HNH endonuclease [Ktedonobacter sp. 13_1_20CM_3_54_15]
MSKVLLLDMTKQPLDPVHPGRARLLLKEGKAAVYRRYPFTLILKTQVDSPAVSALRLKLDPGAKTSGLALVDDASGEVVWAAELGHRGASIKKRIDARRGVRRKRRSRFTRYRKPRFHNRKSSRRKGRLPPSLESRVANMLTWVGRLRRLCPIEVISMELVKFDMQAMQNPEITGAQYQQGERMGYETREYLLAKWGRRCAYCGAEDVPLEIEHILCRARGGTHRVSNLTLACEPCNVKKGTQLIEDFLNKKPDVLARILAQAKTPLKAAAAVNATRWHLFERLKATGLPLETSSGGLTKYNRAKRHLPKTHWLDAACVGQSTPKPLETSQVVPLLIEATGHGNRQMCGVDEHGFPIRHRQRKKVHFGYQTGDLVRAVVPTGARAGTHVGRVLARASGSFDLRTKAGRQAGISYRYCRPIHRNDGYRYQQGGRHAVPATQST